MRRQSKTVIAVMRNRKGKLLMAGDRKASLDWGYAQSMPRPKINKRNGILLGATGDGSLCTLFVDLMKIPDVETDLDNYMFHTFRRSIISILKSQGFVNKDGDLRLPGDSYCELVVGLQSKVYSVIVCNLEGESTLDHHKDSIISIDECAVPYATGCGGALAVGVLQGKLLENKFNTKDDLELAVRVACEVSPGCGLPLDIIQED